MLVIILLSFAIGLLLFAGVPVMLAQAYPIDIQKRIGDMYFWLAQHSFRRLNILRKVLGGYKLHPMGIDDSKHAGTISTDDEQVVQDPMGTRGRIYGKSIVVQDERVPAALDASLAELGEAWHEHVTRGDAVAEQSPSTNGTTATTKVNPYFTVGKETRLVDPSKAIHLITSDADPDDPVKAERYTEKSQEGFRDQVGAVETISLLIGFVGSYGTIVAAWKYVLNGATSSGGGGGSVPAPPIPMGQIMTPALGQLPVVLP